MPSAIPILVSAVATTLGASTLVSAILGIGATLVVAAATKPDRPVTVRGRLIQVREPAWPRELVFGSVRKAGVVVYYETSGSNNEYLHVILVLAGHPVSSIGAIYFDGVEAVAADGTIQSPWRYPVYGYRPTGETMEDNEGNQVPVMELYIVRHDQVIDVVEHLGTVGTSLQSTMLPAEWTTDHRLSGIAAVYLRLKYDSARLNTPPKNITVDVDGLLPLDPPGTVLVGPGGGGGFGRSLTFSKNPALILEWYLTDEDIGIGRGIVSGQRPTQASAINWESLSEAVRICDEQVNGRNRYECSGVIPLSSTPQTIIQTILGSMNGFLIHRNGQWHIQAGAHRTPTVSIDEDDIVEGGIQLVAMTSREAQVNAVRGQFVGPDTDWQPDDYPPYASTTYRTEDGGNTFGESWLDLDLPMTTDPDMCQQIARARLHRARRQQRITFRGTLKCWQLEVGETFSLSYGRWGWTNKTFLVESVRLETAEEGGGPVVVPVISAVETDAQVWAWTTADGSPYTRSPTTSLSTSRFSLPGLPQATQVQYEREDGTVGRRIDITWVDDRPAVDHWEIQYAFAGSVNQVRIEFFQNPITVSSIDRQYSIEPIILRNFYVFHVRAVFSDGTRTLFSASNIIETVERVTLTAPQSVSAIYDSDTRVLHIQWDQSPDADVRIRGVFEIWPLGSQVFTVDGAATSATIWTLEVILSQILVRFRVVRGGIGNWFSDWVIVTVQTTTPPVAAITQQAHPDWPGELVGVVNDGGNLIIDSDGTTLTSGGTYTYPATDLGTDDLAHSYRVAELSTETYNLAGDLLDDRHDTFDEWRDWDDANLVYDTLAFPTLLYRDTDDDPDLPTAQWSTYSNVPALRSRGTQWRLNLPIENVASDGNSYYGVRVSALTMEIVIPEAEGS